MALTLMIWILIVILIVIIFAVKMIKGIVKTAITVFVILLIIIGVTGFLFYLDVSYLKNSLEEGHYLFITEEDEVKEGWSYQGINDFTPSPIEDIESAQKEPDTLKIYISSEYISGPNPSESYIKELEKQDPDFLLKGLLDGGIKTDPSLIGFKIAGKMPGFITKLYY